MLHHRVPFVPLELGLRTMTAWTRGRRDSVFVSSRAEHANGPMPARAG